MKILLLSQRVPYPPNRGDKITTWRLVDRMRRKHEVIIVAFAHDAADFEAADELRGMGLTVYPFAYHDRWKRLSSTPLLLTRKPLTLGVYGSRALQTKVDELAREVDLAYAYSSSMGAFLRPHAHIPRVMHLGELDSDKWRQYSERSSFPMSWVYRREWKTLLEFERAVGRSFDMNVLCTPLEKQIFDEQIPEARSTVLRNGVDLAFFEPSKNSPEPGELVFTGVMDYFPNVDGCVWFAEEILPLVKQRVPAAHFTIIGSKPSAEIQKLGQSADVRVTGFVDDIRDDMRKASVAVAPLRMARGIQNKVLEALAMGLPTVGTTNATQGVNGQSERDYLVRDDAGSFAEAVADLLENKARAETLAAGGRRFVEETYDWEVVFEHLDEILEEVTRKQSVTTS